MCSKVLIKGAAKTCRTSKKGDSMCSLKKIVLIAVVSIILAYFLYSVGMSIYHLGYFDGRVDAITERRI